MSLCVKEESKFVDADHDEVTLRCFYCRGLFLIDPTGIIRQITINDLPVGRSVDETLRVIKAFQFVEKHGEGRCC